MKRLINAFRAFFQALRAPVDAPKDNTSQPTPAADNAHIRLLTLLQTEGRLIDFLQEDISAYTDSQVGAAVRQMHAGCRKSLEETVTIRPVFEEEEGAQINVAAGYDPRRIKLVGSVKGEPPFTGELVHPGWEVKRQKLPKNVGQNDSLVLQPAEVEVRSNG